MAQQSGSRISPVEVEKHLKGADFPSSKQDLVQHARNQNAPDEVIRILESMPDQEYNSAADVAKGVGQVE